MEDQVHHKITVAMPLSNFIITLVVVVVVTAVVTALICRKRNRI